MANLSKINSGFCQIGPCCVVASYCIILAYFSEKRVGDFMKLYCQFNNITADSKREREQKIADYYGNYCRECGLRGLEYIKELHSNHSFGEDSRCTVLASEAEKTPLVDEIVKDIAEKLKIGDRLLMVVYNNIPNGDSCHCVVIGWDSNKSQYFVRDPEKDRPEYMDIFKQKCINEYILFEKHNN